MPRFDPFARRLTLHDTADGNNSVVMRHDANDPDALDPARRTVRAYLTTVIMPLWIAAGSLDYVLHRRSHIERTSGSYEAKIHAFGIALSSVPIVVGFFFEIEAGTIAVMCAGYLAHLGMTVWDVGYANDKRTIVPLEQHVHALLELLPFTALSLVLCAYRDPALALVGRGSRSPSFRFVRKRVPVPRRTIGLTAAAFALFVAVPYVEELVRCLRYEGGAPSERA